MFRLLLKSIGCWSVTVMTLCTILCGTAGATLYELGDSGWTAAFDETNINVITQTYTGAAVVIRIEKTFEGEPDELGLMPFLYLDFYKNREDAAGQIIINDELITNDTSADWIDFHIELEVNVNDSEAGFSPDYYPSGDQFASVILSGSNGYNGLPTKFEFYDGLVPNDPPDQDDFRPGLSSSAMVIMINPQMAIDEKIRLKEYPTIPEPTTVGLLLLGGLAMLRRKRST